MNEEIRKCRQIYNGNNLNHRMGIFLSSVMTTFYAMTPFLRTIYYVIKSILWQISDKFPVRH